MSYLSVRNLSVKYAYGALAVSGLSFEADKGSAVSVFGDAEAGKTTLLKCLAGLIAPVKGEIYIDNREVSNLAPAERNVCLIFEDGGFFENRTALYNLEYPLKLRNLSDEIRADKITRAIRTTKFPENILLEKVRRLSVADRARLAFARAFLRNADVYLIDDPLKNLDEETRSREFPFFAELIGKLTEKSCVVYSTAIAGDCFYFGGNTLFLNYGICLQQGTAADIKSNPTTLTALERFNTVCDRQTATILEENNSIYIEMYGENVYLDKNRLISDVFIGKEAEAVRTKEGKIRLFDSRSEQLIYFD